MLVVWPEYTFIMNCGCDAYACVHVHDHKSYQVFKIYINTLAGASVPVATFTYVLNGVYRAHGLHMYVYGIFHF